MADLSFVELSRWKPSRSIQVYPSGLSRSIHRVCPEPAVAKDFLRGRERSDLPFEGLPLLEAVSVQVGGRTARTVFSRREAAPYPPSRTRARLLFFHFMTFMGLGIRIIACLRGKSVGETTGFGGANYGFRWGKLRRTVGETTELGGANYGQAEQASPRLPPAWRPWSKRRLSPWP